MSFAGGLPAEAMLPAVDWAELPASMGQYGMSEGEPALREAIAAQARALGVPCEASQVLIVSGSQQTLDLASKLFIDSGTEVLVERRPISPRCSRSSCSVHSVWPLRSRLTDRIWRHCVPRWSSTLRLSPT